MPEAPQVGGLNQPFHEGLRDLLSLVDRTKVIVRSILGYKDPSRTALTSTDDSFDWEARRMIVAGSQELIRDRDEIIDATKLNGDPDTLLKARSERLNKAAFYLQRASEHNQMAADYCRSCRRSSGQPRSTSTSRGRADPTPIAEPGCDILEFGIGRACGPPDASCPRRNTSSTPRTDSLLPGV